MREFLSFMLLSPFCLHYDELHLFPLARKTVVIICERCFSWMLNGDTKINQRLQQVAVGCFLFLNLITYIQISCHYSEIYDVALREKIFSPVTNRRNNFHE